MIAVFKSGTLVDFCWIKWFRCDSLRGIANFWNVFFVVFLSLFLEGSVGVNEGVVLDSGSVADIAGSEDVIVFSFVHLNLMQLYK